MAKGYIETRHQEIANLQKTINRIENSEQAGYPGMSKQLKGLRARIQQNKDEIKEYVANPEAGEEKRLRESVLGLGASEEFSGTTNKRGQ